MDEEQLKALQEALKKNIDEGLEKFKTATEEEVKVLKEELKAYQQKLEEVTEKLEKLEALPAGQAGAPAVGTSKMFLGKNIEKQARAIKEKTVDNSGYEYFRREENVDQYARFMIALSKMLDAKRRGIVDNEASEEFLKIYQEMTGKATLNEATDAQGGFLVPDEFQWDLIQLAKDRTFALRECSVLPMGSDTKKWPKELTRASMAWVAENGTISQNDPTFDQLTLTTKKLAGLAAATNEMLADSAIDVVSILTDQFSYGTALELDNQVLNGTGDPVSGVLTAAAGYSVVMATGLTNFSSVTFDDISNLIDQIPEGYDQNLRMVFNKRIKHYLRTIKDSQGRYILNDPGGVTPGTVYEVPYIMSSQAVKTSAASTAFISVGDFKQFFIGQRIGTMTIDVDPYGLFTQDATRFRMVTRWALAIAIAEAFARLLTAA